MTPLQAKVLEAIRNAPGMTGEEIRAAVDAPSVNVVRVSISHLRKAGHPIHSARHADRTALRKNVPQGYFYGS